jgi:hypothetical protein
MRYSHALSHLASSLAIVLVVAVCQPAQAAMTLQVDIQTQTHYAPNQQQKKAPTDTQQSLQVTLTDDTISIKSPQETTILDFKKRRRIVVDNANKTYVDFSLYDIVGFRALEFQNREVLNGAMVAAKVNAGISAKSDIEQILCIQSRSPSKIDETANNDEMIFSADDHQLARWSKNGVAASAADAARFAMYLRYTLGGHPQILAKLAAGNAIPNNLTLTFTDIWGVTVYSMSIQALPQKTADSYDLSAYTKRQPSSAQSKIAEILDKSANMTPEAIAASRQDYQDKLAHAFDGGKPLDAVLGRLEWGLMTGQQKQDFTPEQVTLLRSDPSIQKLFGALRANSKESYTAGIKTMVELRSEAPQKSYMLKLFEANDRAGLRDLAAAQQLFIEVLQANPILAGAYKDLGDVLLTQYETPNAWRCWDFGRRLAPQFKNFAGVDQFEQLLATHHPEYF